MTTILTGFFTGFFCVIAGVAYGAFISRAKVRNLTDELSFPYGDVTREIDR